MAEVRLQVQQTQKLSQNLQTAIHLLSLDLDGLSDYLQKAVLENPALEYLPPRKSAQDYVLAVKARYRSSRGETSGLRELAAREDSQLEDLEQQLRLSGLNHELERAAQAILHQLSPRGYFLQELDEFAADLGIPLALAQQALEAVQALEPAGVGARSVEECLELQLRARPEADPLCRELIKVYLLEISKGNLRQIARETGASPALVKQCVDTIKGLSPAPCSLFEEAAHYIMPEFSVENGPNGELSILFHNDYFPTFRKDRNFERLLEALPKEEQPYARNMLLKAGQLLQAAELRQVTIEKVARIILREQHAFFRGLYTLMPLKVSEAAREIAVHETTVYRAIQNKYLYCARGTFPLSHFFQQEMKGGASKLRVKELITALCLETPGMSDREITEALEARGIQLSRRTVAKYRAQMDIQSSFQRGGER